MKSSELTIGEVAGHFSLPTHVLRHWESVGLLEPARVYGSRRRFTPADLYRVAAILRAKEAGLSLADIRTMFAASGPGTRREVLTRHHETLTTRIASLTAAKALLETALSCEHEDLATCPHFQGHLKDLYSL
ncbi:MerR family transcriptional regulator [Actinophytocola xanthii]|uniref:MerR family transcriptional regulator n=1 Tax=Actinophytocola xanthii TaxID=1912961 RepID=A0A1Q8CLK7_9PSEU|nr:MerR family transcriptional regulator [Actinophytocola xanthii]OLF15234.1 MerR family transcriptional regulator [Actinophytocola xanthii]